VNAGGDDLAAAIASGVESVTKKWAKQRKAEERKASAYHNRRQAMTRTRQVTIKEVAWSVMEQAYRKASANGTLPANARQIMYAARPMILARTGRDQMDDQYFIQTLLTDYIIEHGLGLKWDVIFDARGHLTEPHTQRLSGMTPIKTPLGTLGVRNYLAKSVAGIGDPLTINHLPLDYPTAGSNNRYSSVLFLEKEGFAPLLEQVEIAKRYDLAIMSTKGMSNVAARALVDQLAGEGVQLLVARDFDKSGFSIAATLTGDTRRYRFGNRVDVTDLGLRLSDVETYSLEAEPVYYKERWWKVEQNLHRNGATPAEVEFLRDRRVELNAFTSDQLVGWLEAKLEEHGVEKVVPDVDTLAIAYRRVLARRAVNAKIDELSRSIRESADTVAIPADLADQVQQLLDDDPSRPWDDAVAQIAADDQAGAS
jgi:hypothetical protein